MPQGFFFIMRNPSLWDCCNSTVATDPVPVWFRSGSGPVRFRSGPVPVRFQSGSGPVKSLVEGPVKGKGLVEGKARDNGIPGHDNPPVQAGRARTEFFYQSLFLYRNQIGEFVVKSCTRHTNCQNIFFLKIYISRFFQAKTSPGIPQNTPYSSPNNPQNLPKSAQYRPKIDLC